MSFEGEIGEIDLIDRLVELGSEQFTGAIRFESDGIIKIVYFKGGDVLSASTNDRTDAIDEILQRANKVTREHIKQALAKRKESETLGDALLGLGFITRKELTWARRVQVIGIIRSIVGWTTGSYTIVADYLPKREEGTLFSLSQIIVELVVTDNDRSKSERAMDSGNAVFEKAPQFDDAFRRLGLNEDAEQIAAQIDGHNSAAEVASRSGKDAFNVYKLIEALRILRLVNHAGKPPAQHEVSDPRSVNAWEVENPDFTLDDDPALSPSSPSSDEWIPPSDSPTLDIPAVDAAAWEAAQTAAQKTARSVWDEPADDDRFSETASVPPPASYGTANSELDAEPEWGFDEAQIEAARRAAVPVRGKDEKVPASAVAGGQTKQPRSRVGLWLTLLLLAIIAGGAYPAWQWWQARNAPEPVIPVRRAKLRPTIATPPVPVAEAALTTSAPSPVPATMPPTITAPVITPVRQATAIPSVATPIPSTSTRRTPVPVSVPTVRTSPGPAVTAAPHLERNTAGAPTITNSPTASAPVSDATRAKYDALARDFAADKSGVYTVQFELVCETTSITRALSDVGDKVWFVSMSYRGRPCYRVFWGRFQTSGEAVAASKTMPSGLGATPVVVKIPR